MKKRFTLLFSLLLLMVLLTGCSNATTSIIQSGNYHLFRTHSSEEYLKFLETFDYSSYEIIDITVSASSIWNHAITYKTKFEAK